MPELNLIPIETVNALEVFTEDGMDPFLAKIKDEVSNFEADVTTAKGRGEIKSIAYKIILSKGVIDRAGAGLVKEWRAKTKIVDASRRKAKVFLDELSADVRTPLTDWEIETDNMLADAERKALILEAHDAALVEHEIWLREKVLAEGEAKLKEEDEERQREETQRLADEAETKRVEKIRIEAKSNAKREAAEAIQQERDRLAEVRREAAEAADREKERVKQAKKDTIEAAELAEKEQDEAVEAERKRVVREQVERDRITEEQVAEKREVEAKRQANTDNRRDVNRGALKALKEIGFGTEISKQFITVIYQEKIPGIRMVY